MGIPPSQLDGREPQVTTVYEYRFGRLARSVTTSEPRWTEQDRAEMLALSVYRAELCPGCGQPLAESTAHYEVGPEYETHRTTCRACAALLEAQRGSADGGTGDANARLWTVTPVRR